MAGRSAEDRRKRAALLVLLRQVRIDAGLRQVDVAEKLGVPQSYVSNYESGERRLDVLELRRVCEVVGISSVQFMTLLEGSFIRNLGRYTP